MSDKSELQQRAEEVLVDLINKATEIGSAAVDEIPLVVQELLTWKFAESLVFFLSGIVLFIVFTIINTKFWNSGSVEDKYGRIKRSNWDGEWAYIILSTVLYLTISLVTIFNNIDWLQIWIAPRVYLLEYAASLVK